MVALVRWNNWSMEECTLNIDYCYLHKVSEDGETKIQGVEWFSIFFSLEISVCRKRCLFDLKRKLERRLKTLDNHTMICKTTRYL